MNTQKEFEGYLLSVARSPEIIRCLIEGGDNSVTVTVKHRSSVGYDKIDDFCSEGIKILDAREDITTDEVSKYVNKILEVIDENRNTLRHEERNILRQKTFGLQNVIRTFENKMRKITEYSGNRLYNTIDKALTNLGELPSNKEKREFFYE